MSKYRDQRANSETNRFFSRFQQVFATHISGVSINGGSPKWMVFVRENPIEMDDLEVSLFQESHMSLHTVFACCHLLIVFSSMFSW